jgi:glutathione S-transferase
MSPFCLKVEAYFRLRGLGYEWRTGDLRAAPRGQLPWVEVSGERLGDSNLILDRFEAENPEPLDAWLDPDARARGWSLMRTFEESTVWVLLYQRFIDEAGWPATREVVRSILPTALRWVGPTLVRRDMQRAVRAQGMGRYDDETIYAFGRRDIDAAAHALGDREYLFGDRITTFDLSLFGFVSSFACSIARSPVTEHLLDKANLLDHCERLRQRLFPEIPSWVAQPLELAG